MALRFGAVIRPRSECYRVCDLRSGRSCDAVRPELSLGREVQFLAGGSHFSETYISAVPKTQVILLDRMALA
jgi:hypothetical protein